MENSKNENENPVQNKQQQAFEDQRSNKNPQDSEQFDNVKDDEEDDGSPVLDESDLEENKLSEDDADNIEWDGENESDTEGQPNKAGKQKITNAADTGSANKGTDDDNRTGSNTMRTQDQPLK